MAFWLFVWFLCMLLLCNVIHFIYLFFMNVTQAATQFSGLSDLNKKTIWIELSNRGQTDQIGIYRLSVSRKEEKWTDREQILKAKLRTDNPGIHSCTRPASENFLAGSRFGLSNEQIINTKLNYFYLRKFRKGVKPSVV